MLSRRRKMLDIFDAREEFSKRFLDPASNFPRDFRSIFGSAARIFRAISVAARGYALRKECWAWNFLRLLWIFLANFLTAIQFSKPYLKQLRLRKWVARKFSGRLYNVHTAKIWRYFFNRVIWLIVAVGRIQNVTGHYIYECKVMWVRRSGRNLRKKRFFFFIMLQLYQSCIRFLQNALK